jgi:hypothetical protein
MKTKHITTIALIGALIFTTPNFGAKNNPITSMLMSNWNHARTWSNNFYHKCQYVGVLPTIYATFGIYNFNSITGLNEDKLNTYNSDELKNALNRVETMIEYGAWTEKLNQFFMQLIGKYEQALHNEKATAAEKKEREEIDASYDEKKVAQEVEEMIRAQRAAQQKK